MAGGTRMGMMGMRGLQRPGSRDLGTWGPLRQRCLMAGRAEGSIQPLLPVNEQIGHSPRAFQLARQKRYPISPGRHR